MLITAPREDLEGRQVGARVSKESGAIIDIDNVTAKTVSLGVRLGVRSAGKRRL